jgi:beta-lactamase regulating signal transducer with metallopeptidase domain
MIPELLNHLWQSTLFCGGVWLLTLALRGDRAAVRHGLWVAAALKFLVPFSALFAAGALFSFATPTDAGPPMLGVGMNVAAPVMSPAISLREAAREPAPVLWIALFTWIAGATVLAARWLKAWWAAESVVREARPAPGLPADVRVTDAEIEPSAARVIRPVVLLPATLLQTLAPAQLEAVIAHERAHIARRDNLFSHIQRCIESLFWFHPLVWWIGRRQVDERERACDERVLDEGHDEAEYAAGILAVCRHTFRATCSPATASALSGDLSLRIRSILGSARPRALNGLKAAALSIATITVAAGPLAAGAVDDAARRQAAFATNARLLDSAAIYVGTMHGDGGLNLDADAHVIHVRNSTVRELVAAAYDVNPKSVWGEEDGLDSIRYELRAESNVPFADPERLDPRVLRGVVNKLLTSRFHLQILVNGREPLTAGAAR